MTLLSEIQEVLERTYRPSGIRLEDCLISARRSQQLTQCLEQKDHELSPRARTYLRQHEGSLYIGLYFDPGLIEELERHDPRQTISHHNIVSLISFIEEITHGVHAALAFHAGWRALDSEQFACNLEMQARVDTYWVLLRYGRILCDGPIPEKLRPWIQERLFGDEQTSYANRGLQRRYLWAREGARCFVGLCERADPKQRSAWIREFQGLSLLGKKRFLRRHGVL
ncbi:MAG: hypothetical protein HC904_11815 [Blastochloris sp.]|nr:hypothetical protein [Blastochloris sp.]